MGPKKEFHFRRHFRLRAVENERCIFGRPLYQTDSYYTLRQWFSNTQQSRFRTACRCLVKLVLPSIFDTSHPSSSPLSSSSRSPSELLRRSVTTGDLRSPQRRQSVVVLLNHVEPDVARATRRCSPAVHCLSAFV